MLLNSIKLEGWDGCISKGSHVFNILEKVRWGEVWYICIYSVRSCSSVILYSSANLWWMPNSKQMESTMDPQKRINNPTSKWDPSSDSTSPLYMSPNCFKETPASIPLELNFPANQIENLLRFQAISRDAKKISSTNE